RLPTPTSPSLPICRASAPSMQSSRGFAAARVQRNRPAAADAAIISAGRCYAAFASPLRIGPIPPAASICSASEPRGSSASSAQAVVEGSVGAKLGHAGLIGLGTDVDEFTLQGSLRCSGGLLVFFGGRLFWRSRGGGLVGRLVLDGFFIRADLFGRCFDGRGFDDRLFRDRLFCNGLFRSGIVGILGRVRLLFDHRLDLDRLASVEAGQSRDAVEQLGES